ncbi:MAG: phosphate ABC transporter substrate-binding protein PstS, partial [Lapillicoccus sp.]
MRITRTTAVSAIALAGTLALSACGSDNNSGGTGGAASGSASVSAADCGSGTLNAEGSTAQLKAIQQAISLYQAA